VLLIVLLLPLTSRAVDYSFDVLQTKTAVYSNVTVTSKSADYIMIQHANGLASLRVVDLPAHALQTMGFAAPKSSTDGILGVKARTRAIVEAIPAQQIEQAWSKHAPAGVPPLKININILFVVLSIIVVAYLFFCYCGSLICKKAGKPAGVLIWLPVLQYIPLFRAANMSPLWFLAMFVPVLNLVAHFLWSFRIAGARGKGLLTALFLFLPTYPLAFMYLAFSGGGSSEETPPAKFAAQGLTADNA
jgi:hypothetical protein